MLLSQLAETSAQERVLLEECGHLLSVAASLEVQNTFTGRHIVSSQVNIEIGTSKFATVLLKLLRYGAKESDIGLVSKLLLAWTIY
jgi:hypothetical protein